MSKYQDFETTMYDDYEIDIEEERRRKRRSKRRAERRRKRRRQVMIYRAVFGAIVLLLIAGIIFGVSAIIKMDSDPDTSKGEIQVQQPQADDTQTAAAIDVQASSANDTQINSADAAPVASADDNDLPSASNAQMPSTNEDSSTANPPKKTPAELAFFESESTSYMGSEEMTSTYGLLVNVDGHSVVSAKNAYDRISPASMTKIMTLLVACENIDNLEDTVTITIEDTDYAYSHDCSAVGFAENEEVRVKDLLYGTILPSGGDAAHALARYVAGSHEAFVELMNARLEELDIAVSAHFTNCVGIYDDNHYCNLYDMAVILEAAMDNPTCRQILSTHRYTTTPSAEHPDGIDISNLFLRRIEDKDTLGEVVGAKTGYVVQSGNCAASYYTCNDGTNYICVTADAHSAWRCIYDHVAIYNIYAANNTGYKKE